MSRMMCVRKIYINMLTEICRYFLFVKKQKSFQTLFVYLRIFLNNIFIFIYCKFVALKG